MKGISLFPTAVRDLYTCLFVFSCYNVYSSFCNFLEITKMNYFLFLNHHGPGQSSSTFPFRNTRHALLNSTVIFLYNFLSAVNLSYNTYWRFTIHLTLMMTRSGCRKVSQCHHEQSFRGLHSPECSYLTDLYDSWFKPFTLLNSAQ